MLTHTNSPTFWNKRWSEKDRVWYGHFRDIVEMLPDQGKLIDVGCGVGTLLEYIRDNKPDLEIEGRDYSDVAVGKLNEKGIPAIVEKLPFISGNADIVTATEVLEHLEDDDMAIKNISRTAKIFIATVPNNRWGNDKCREHIRKYTKETLKEKILTHFDSCEIKEHGPYLIAYGQSNSKRKG